MLSGVWCCIDVNVCVCVCAHISVELTLLVYPLKSQAHNLNEAYCMTVQNHSQTYAVCSIFLQHEHQRTSKLQCWKASYRSLRFLIPREKL